MRRLLASFVSVVVMASCLVARSEYQVYDYRASFKVVERSPKGGGRLVSCMLKGYLVTVCCYPCGADYGKGYQSWLFVTSSRLGKKVIWRLPCEVSGGLFGSEVDPLRFSDYRWIEPTTVDLKLGKKGDRSYFFMRFSTESAEDEQGRGVWGPRALVGQLMHAGFGSGAVKYNPFTADPQAVWNPYVKTASGAVTGYSVLEAIGFQPSNRNPTDVTPLSGTFAVKFNGKLTDEIRGVSDWDVIARRILLHMKTAVVVEEPYDEALMWSSLPL